MSSALRALFAVLAIGALPLLMTAQEPEKPAARPADAKTNYLELAGKAAGGEWVDEKGIKDPAAPHGRFTSEWGVNKKLLRSKTFWVNNRKATQIYEGSSWWHPERKEVAFMEMAMSGELYEGNIEEKDGVSIARWKAYSEKGVSEYEQHGKYLDDDTMESTVYTKKDGKLTPMHSFKFHRKPIGWELDKEPVAKKDDGSAK